MPEARRRFHAPGRVNLIGEHTDQTGGLVLPAAIDRGISLEVELGGRVIQLASRDADGEVRLAADGSGAPSSGWGRFVAAVAAELAEMGRAPIGMRGVLTSDLPQGSGLASSAALEVVVALALVAASDFELAPLQLAALCRRAEYRAVGVPSGIMDQGASLLGRAGHALFLDCSTMAHRPVALPADHVLLVLDSGVRRSLETTPYADRTREVLAGLPALGGRRPADVAPEELDGLLAVLDPVPARRLRHVVTENARVRATELALRRGDLHELGRLFEAGHESLRDDFEATTPETDTLVLCAREAGAVAARMTGAGFGGAIVAVVSIREAEAVALAVLERYRERYPGRAGSAIVCEPRGGARELT
ncbi:MAG: galactokinase [Candidatus Limnocylindria bacterium]